MNKKLNNEMETRVTLQEPRAVEVASTVSEQSKDTPVLRLSSA